MRPHTGFGRIFVGCAALIAASALAQTVAPTSAVEEKKKDDAVELPAFEVLATQDTGYTARQALSGNKTSQALENLAGAYSIVPNDLLRDLGAVQNAPEGIKFVVPGITPFVHGDQYMIRGRRSSTSTDEGASSTEFFGDGAVFDSIEVMKGPQAVLYGQQAGMFGMIMRITKKPLPVFRGSVKAYYGSNDFKRAEIDVTGPAAYGLSYRVIGVYQDAESYLKNGFDTRKVTALQLQWRNEKTTIRLHYEHQDLMQRGDDVQFGAAGKNWNMYTGAGRDQGWWAEWGHYWDLGNIIRLNAVHEFNDNWQTRLQVSRAKTFRDYIYLLSPAVNYATNSYTQDYFNYYEDMYQRTVSWDNMGKYNIGNAKLQTNFGYSWDEFVGMNATRSYIPGWFTGVLSAPNYHGVMEPRNAEGASLARGAVPTNTSSYLLQTADLLSGKLILSGGVAYNKSVVEDQDTHVVSTDQGEWVKRAGVVFKPLKNLSVYYGWATMFNPQSVTTIDFAGNPMPVVTGKGSEIGVKASFLDGRLLLTADYYKLARTNISVFTGKTNDRGLGYYELVGDENSKGWEFDIHAQLTKDWQLVAVAWKGDSLDRNGVQFYNSLKESAGLFTRYNFSSGSLSGFGIGGGAYGQGRRNFGDSTAAGYYQFNAFASYQLKNFTMTLNVENLADTQYVAGAWARSAASGGVPRSFRLMVERRF